MNLIQLIINILVIKTYQCPRYIFAKYIDIPVNETLNDAIIHFGQCVFDIIDTNFKIGSIIGFVTAGLENYTSPSLSNNSPDESLRNLMLNESWPIVIKQGYNSRSTRTKV